MPDIDTNDDSMQSELSGPEVDFSNEFAGTTTPWNAMALHLMTTTRWLTKARPVGRRAVFVLLATFLACGDDGGGLVEPDGTVLQGIVVQAGTQVLLTDVPVTMDGRTVRTDDRGTYRFDDVPVGEVTLTVAQTGYLPYERRLQIEEGVNNFDIALLPD